MDVSLESLPGIEDDPLAELRRARKRRGEDADDEEETKPRPFRVGTSSLGQSGREGILWSDDGRRLVLHLFSHDHKDR